MNHRLDTQICEPSIGHRDLGTIGDREHTDLYWTLSFITDVVHRERRITPIPNPGTPAVATVTLRSRGRQWRGIDSRRRGAGGEGKMVGMTLSAGDVAAELQGMATHS
ncbi:hypothetical protein L6452_15087 [Arctium lappa]|uniref:Uncharacterized protein n=1 Tax=Arctium lappa TaxID=4217 RepID=A0ACB9CMW2_ARCLA|nr:hypothetical protein L6452_15087 [Arctium lappa]